MVGIHLQSDISSTRDNAGRHQGRFSVHLPDHYRQPYRNEPLTDDRARWLDSAPQPPTSPGFTKPRGLATPPTSPAAHKHLIDLTEDDDSKHFNKKNKSVGYSVLADPFMEHAISSIHSDHHPSCFHSRYLALLANQCKDNRRPCLSKFRKVPPCKGLKTAHPLHLCLSGIGATNKNIAGHHIILSVDKTGVNFSILNGQRVDPPEELLSSTIPGTKHRYFDHAVWFIECTNLNTVPKKCFGLAIAVMTISSDPKQPIKVELGFTIFASRDHFIYALFNKSVVTDPQSSLPVPSYLLLESDHCNSLLDPFFGGAFDGPY